jgi:hypothetical protein
MLPAYLKILGLSMTLVARGTATTYSIGDRSVSGKTFGMVVNKGSTGTLGVTFYVGTAVKKW